MVVALGLSLQVTWYLVQMLVVAGMSPLRFLRGALDVMANTFSTASTAATIPITLRSLGRLGVSRRSSQLTACIGTNFNNDGTALYQATAVLFIAQALGFNLSLGDQIMIMLTTLIASVGAGGIPSGSFVTMPLIFAAVRMPVDKIPILLTVDWLLDRLRTTSNVLGDMTVAVLLDRVSPPGRARSGRPGGVCRAGRLRGEIESAADRLMKARVRDWRRSRWTSVGGRFRTVDRRPWGMVTSIARNAVGGASGSREGIDGRGDSVSGSGSGVCRSRRSAWRRRSTPSRR